jgi:hypothetical protein
VGLLTPRPDYTGAGPGTDGGGTVVRYRTVAGLPGDREQVTTLVNAHIAAVVRGVSVSGQGLMSQLEREPGEFIVVLWVRDRVTLVAEQRGREIATVESSRHGALFPRTEEVRHLERAARPVGRGMNTWRPAVRPRIDL